MSYTGFFHGVETRYIDRVPAAVRTVQSNICAIVGTAPVHLATTATALNDPELSLSDVEDIAKFGPKIPGYTLPYALDVLRDYEVGTVEVINVFDPATNTTTASDISYTYDAEAGFVQLKRVLISDLTEKGIYDADSVSAVTVEDGAAATMVLDTDYTLDTRNGRIIPIAGGAIADGETITVTYTYPDPDRVTATDIIGTVVNSDRTGMQAMLDVYFLRGYRPKLLAAPWFSENPSVAAELLVIANKLNAYCGIDAPAGVIRDEAVAGRNGTAPAAAFNTSDRRAVLCYPRMENSDGVMIPYSVHWMGRTSLTDVEKGFWKSPSNERLRNAIRPEIRLTSDFTSQDTDVNLLNSKGIYTYSKEFGTGYLAWGNRSALFPSDEDVTSFICVGRNLDITLESCQAAMRVYVDEIISDPLIDDALNTLNAYCTEQILLGAMYAGSRFYYDPQRNPGSQLRKGQIVFSYGLGFPTPAEWIVLEGSIDINLYEQIGATLEAA